MSEWVKVNNTGSISILLFFSINISRIQHLLTSKVVSYSQRILLENRKQIYVSMIQHVSVSSIKIPIWGTKRKLQYCDLQNFCWNKRTYDNNTCTNVPTYILYQCITIRIWSYIVHTYVRTYSTSYYIIPIENITWCAYCARNVQIMFYLMIQTFYYGTIPYRTVLYYFFSIFLFFFLIKSCSHNIHNDLSKTTK